MANIEEVKKGVIEFFKEYPQRHGCNSDQGFKSW